MDKVTRKFKRLPPDGGVHFTGFGDVKIPSRNRILKEVRDFLRYCQGEARSPAVRVILAPWGEGKTELYCRYIEERVVKSGGHAYLLSASSLASLYARWRTLTVCASEQLLAAALVCAHEEAGAQEIRPYDPSTSPGGLREWMSAAIQELTHHGADRVFFFIDEVEELLHAPDDLRQLLQGLKELVNGQYSPISEGGEFAGCVHFFLSCTPEAYNRFSTDPEISQVFGGYDRRAKTVDLPAISSMEALRFLVGLLRYCYEGGLPTQLPIANIGVLNALAWAGQRNLGNMVSLLVRTLSSLEIDGKSEFVRVATGEDLLVLLRESAVMIYGERSPCLEHDLLSLLEHKVGALPGSHAAGPVLRKLVGEPHWRPVTDFSTADPDQASSALAVLENVGQALGAAGYPAAVWYGVKCPNEEAFWAALKDYWEQKSRAGVRLPIGLEELRDRLCQIEIDSAGDAREVAFVPHDPDTWAAVCEGLPGADLQALGDVPTVNVTDESLCCRLSDSVLAQIYPPPCPPGLAFIIDRADRYALWRQVTDRFATDYVALVPSGLLEALKRGAPNIEVTEAQRSSGFARGQLALKELDGRHTRMSAVFMAFPSPPESGDAGKVERILQQNEPVHIVIALYSGDAPLDDVRAALRTDPPALVMPLGLHAMYAKQLMAIAVALDMPRVTVSERLLAEACVRLVAQETRIEERLQEWFRAATDVGIVVSNPVRHGGSEGELVEAMRFFLNCYDCPRAISDVFDFNAEELRRTVVRYGAKSGLVPDIEGRAKFEQLAADLRQNGFLQLDRSGNLEPRLTPVESRIIDLLDTNEGLPENELGKYFVVRADNSRLLADFYLRVLINRGLVHRMQRRVRLTEPKLMIQEIRRSLKLKRAQVQDVNDQPCFATYTALRVCKQRDCQALQLHVVESHIDRALAVAEQHLKDGDSMRAAAAAEFGLRLTDDYGALANKARLAMLDGKHIVDETEEMLASLILQIEVCLAATGVWLDYHCRSDGVRDLCALAAGAQSLRALHESDYSEDDAASLGVKLDLARFDHTRFEDDGYTFSPKHEALRQLKAAWDQDYEQTRAVARALAERCQEWQSELDGIRSSLLTYSFDEDCQIAERLREQLLAVAGRIGGCGANGTAQAKADAKDVSLLELKRDLEAKAAAADADLRRLAKAVTSLDGIGEAERNCLDRLEGCWRLTRLAEAHFDCHPWSDRARGCAELGAGLKEEYRALLAEVTQSISSTPVPHLGALTEWERKLRHLDGDAGELDGMLETEAWAPFSEEIVARNERLTRMEQRLHLTTSAPPVSLPPNLATFLEGDNRASDISQILDERRHAVMQAIRSRPDTSEWHLLRTLAQRFVETGDEEVTFDDLLQLLGATGADHDKVARALRDLCAEGWTETRIVLKF